MSKKLFIGGLSWNINDSDLREAFEGFGEIEDVHVVLDRDTGRSRGFGFVTFVNDNDATQAINDMNGKELDGRKIGVNAAEERKKEFSPRDRNNSRRDYR